MNKANAILRAITPEWKTCRQIANDSGVKEFTYVSATVSRLCSSGYAERKFAIHCKPQYFRKKAICTITIKLSDKKVEASGSYGGLSECRFTKKEKP